MSKQIQEAYIVAATRSPVGKAPRGMLKNVRPDDLLAHVLKSAVAQCPGLDLHEVGDVITGCAMPEGEQGMNVARIGLLLAGFPDTVPGLTINRFCSSGVQAAADAAKESFSVIQRVQRGSRDLQLAVAGYRQYTRKVLVHYIDYLFVEYQVSRLGLRRKKRNLPRLNGHGHRNRILINAPLFQMNYWRLETESSLLYTEEEYRQAPKVRHPDRIAFEGLEEEIHFLLPNRLHRPTLYRLSKIAFPVRWVDRKGPWTREDLEKIEQDEAEGSAWWFQHGPGRK